MVSSWFRYSCSEVAVILPGRIYKLGNFLCWLALPQGVKHWSLTTLKEKLVKMGTKVVTRARYVTFLILLEWTSVSLPKADATLG